MKARHTAHVIKRTLRDSATKARGLGRKKDDASEAPQFTIVVDSPNRISYSSRKLVVSGWIIASGNTVIRAMRLKNNERYMPITQGKERPDVAELVEEDLKERALHSGFNEEIQFTDGLLDIEVDFGMGFTSVFSTQIQHSTELLVDMTNNPNLGRHWAEHENLLDSRKRYYWEAPSQETYARHDQDTKILAFYLPQFHPIPENDAVWGRGFTEWTNVTTAKPRFVGHQQPILPSDLGFYDLRLDETISEQIALAKRQGIYGFCMYYYWFSGRRLLEKPLDTLLRHTEWDFNFAICWANENWTKRWDGLNDDVIVAQQHNEDDPLKFIQDVESILLDPRYVTVDGKPMLIVYRAVDLGEPERYATIWRDYFRKTHDRELHLVSVLGFDLKDPREYGFDVALNFAPLTSVLNKQVFPGGELPLVDIRNKILDINYEGGIVDYRKIFKNKELKKPLGFPTYNSVMPSWDNEARKKGKGASFHKVSPDIYAKWLDETLTSAEAGQDASFVFINAWNEWAEGAMLEPTLHQGHAVLNRTTEVLAAHSKNDTNHTKFPVYGIKRAIGTKLAILVHAYYADGWSEIQKRLLHLDGIPFDLFVSINQKDTDLADRIRKAYPDAYIKVAPNRGRDILPFVYWLHRIDEARYEYVLKLHTKKSIHRADGANWSRDLLGKLLPGKKQTKQIFARLETGATLIGPSGHYVSSQAYMGSNEVTVRDFLTDMGLTDGTVERAITDGYFAGSMFWARVDSLRPLKELYLMPDDFEAEEGQIDGTLSHAIERVITIMQLLDDKIVLAASQSDIVDVKDTPPDEAYTYAPPSST